VAVVTAPPPSAAPVALIDVHAKRTLDGDVAAPEPKKPKPAAAIE
jgi:hypothetical protein